jgi:hypothetical protein
MQTRAFQWVMPGLVENSATDVTAKERSAHIHVHHRNHKRGHGGAEGVCLHVVAFIIRRGASLVSLMSGSIGVGTYWRSSKPYRATMVLKYCSRSNVMVWWFSEVCMPNTKHF